MKIRTMWVCLFVAVLFLGSCSQKESTEEKEEKTYLFKYSNSQSDSHPRSKSMAFFKEELEKASNGRIVVELYTGGKLGNEADVLDMVKTGQIQGCRGGLFERVNKKYLIYTLPFMWENTDQVLKAMRSDFGKKVNDGAQANGFYVPACGVAGGFRNVTTNVKPIKGPADVKGLKIRTPPIDMTLKTFKALGANPQQVAYTETYMALKTGVVDAQENPFSNIVDMKFYEAQKYLSVINWQIHPDPLYVNPDWYNSLPSDLQKVFDDVSVKTMEYSDKIWLASENDFLNTLKDNLEVNAIDNDARLAFAGAVKAVWQGYVDEGNFSQSEIDAAIAAGK